MAEEKIFINEAEVTEYYLADKENNQVVLFEGVVYDVKDYAPEHPGGPEYLLDNLGKDIEEPFEEAEHTKSARKVFKDLPIIGRIGIKPQNDTKSEVKEIKEVD